jgi:hypothetical protein
MISEKNYTLANDDTTRRELNVGALDSGLAIHVRRMKISTPTKLVYLDSHNAEMKTIRIPKPH